MEATSGTYDFAASRARMDTILAAADASYEEVNSIPARDKLTFTNGFYVNCSALFVDIRDSSKLADSHTRPTLAKLYRAYISELVAVFNSAAGCREVNIHGDAVWAVFETPYKPDIDGVLETAGKSRSLVDVLNYKLGKKGIATIRVGIGMSYGRALMIKAGHAGSTINEVVWMGDVVNEAAHLTSYGNKSSSDCPVMISSSIYSNLKADYQQFFSWNFNRSCYHGDVVNLVMDEWLGEQK